MLWTIAVILFILWALGLATAYTMSGFIHILFVLAIVVVFIRVIQGRRQSSLSLPSATFTSARIPAFARQANIRNTWR
jgi:hypothetical protein